MALISLKQLDSVLTGSLQVSGSAGFTGSISLRAGDKLFTGVAENEYIQTDSPDRMRFVVGGSQMLLLDQDESRVNVGYGHKLGVGLGNNTTPGTELEVQGHISASGNISGSDIYAGGTLFGPVDDNFDIKSDKDVRVYLDTDNDGTFHKFQVFNEDGDVKFAIASDGKSAIGGAVTSTSLDGLSVTGGITATGNVTASGHISSSGEISGSGIYSAGPITILDSGTGTPTAKILVRSSNNKLNIGDTIVVNDSNNRVGMGDTPPSSPDTELHIKSDTPVITLQRTDNEDRGAIEFQGQGGSVGAHIEYVSETNDLSFGTFDGSDVHEKLRLEDGATGNIKVSGSTQITGSLNVSTTITANAFSGDGSSITGVTAEWDGSHNGDASITGSLNISATASIGRGEFTTISASSVDVDEGTLRIGGVGLTKTMAENITGSFGVELPGQTILSGSLESTASAAKLTAGTTVETDKIESLTANPKSRIYLSHPSNKRNAQLALNYRSYNVFEATGSGDDMHITIGSDANSARSDITLQGFTTGGAAAKVSAIFVEGVGSKIGMGGITSPTTAVHISGSGDSNLYVEGQISSSQWVSASTYYGDGSNLTGIQSGIFQATGSTFNVTDDLQITGSLKVNAALTSSTAIYTNNIQNGYPTSNLWGEGLDGSYFNNFDNTSHVSEILRFIAGIISHSIDTSSPTANTKTWASVDTNNNNLGSTASQIAGRLPQEHTSISNTTLNYLVHKGWTGPGRKVFDSISIYNDDTYFIDFDSNSGGSTSVNSSADSELFGLGGLSSGNAQEFFIRVVATQSFSDTGSVATPTPSSNTFTTQSFFDNSISTFGTSNGLTLAKIESANPAVIPAAFQDGKFENIGGTSLSGSLTRRFSGSNPSLHNDFSSISSSGYYNFQDLVVGIKTGSQGDYVFKDGTDKKHFFAPRAAINTAIGDNTLADVGTTTRSLTAVSRSLSGAPYVTGSTYEISTKITGLFNPLYASTTTLTDMNAGSVGVGSVSITNDNISTSGGTIQTSNAIYDSGVSSARNTSTVPHYNDVAIVSASVDWDAGNDENINQTGVGDTTFTVTVRARDRDSSYSSLDTQTLHYHSSSMFGAPLASGSMACYGRAQGYDGGSLTGTTELFTGEDFRIQLADNVQQFNGTAWTTTFELGQLGDYDLQVKPGFLVDPGGSYRYWHPSGYGSGTYKYYIRRFQTSGTKSSMTVNLNNNTLIAWNATTNGISCAILFKSSGKGSGTNNELSTARIYDPTATTSNLIEADISNDNHKNPFTTAISLYGNTGGSISSNTYTVPIRNADGMYLDNDDNELYIIVRYKGDPTPLDDITLTFS